MVSIKKSKNMITRYVLRSIEEEQIRYLDEYTKEILRQQFVGFKNEEEISNFFRASVENLYNNCVADALEIIRYYTGKAFGEVNNVLRNNWNYELNGELTLEKSEYYRKLAYDLREIIDKSAISIDNIVTYRGVTIDAFKRYGINSLQELGSLKEQFIYESGFISTALLRQRSFFNRELDFVSHCNIEIEYLIPGDSQDAIPLVTNDTSYSLSQTEYLINSGNLSKVVDVKVDKEKNLAYLRMVYIPKKVWDKTYEPLKKNSSGRS